MRVPRALPPTLLAAALALAGASARADTEHRAIVVLVEGPDSEAVSSAIGGHVQAPDEVRDPRAFRAALASRGTFALGPAVGRRGRDAQLVQRAHAAAAEAHVDVAILVTARKAGRGRVLHVWLIDAHADGAVVDKDVPLPAGAGASEAGEAVWAASASALPPRSAAPAPPPVVTPPGPAAPSAALASGAGAPPGETTAADEGTTAEPAGAGSRPSRMTALAVLGASIEAGSRHFSYVDRLTPTLRPYDLFAAPMVAVDVEAYPFARSRVPVLQGLGIAGDYARAFGIASADAGGTKVGTSWQSFDVGLRERVALGPELLLGVAGGYGANIFDFDQPAFAAQLPTVDYRVVRVGVDMRGFLGGFSVFGGASWLDVLSTGGVGQLFPRESVGGLEARLGGAYAASRSIELSLGITYTRFFYSLNPQPGDANVAGGALDEMARLSLGFAYLL